MKILCLLDDQQPVTNEALHEELAGHELLILRDYKAAKEVLLDPSVSFDVMLADVTVPYQEGEKPQNPMSPFLLARHFDRGGGQGLGIFVPQYFETVFAQPGGIGMAAQVATKRCWTDAGKRDWKKLLDLVSGLLVAPR